MTGVVREIYALAGIGLAIDPAHTGTAEEAGQCGQDQFDEHCDKWLVDS
jgi:hypothetical protein